MKITTIIPAYNEEERIAQVIESIQACHLVNKIIVVDDGSTDKTAAIAAAKDATVLKMVKNIGKGGAMQKGIEAALEADLIAFVDADLIGFMPEHMEKMINPFVDDEKLQMSVGIFKGGRKTTDLAQYIAPQISGQRVVRREFLDTFPDISSSRFGVEIAINNHARKSNVKTKNIILENVTHVMKEEKLGKGRGFFARLKMYNEILRYFIRKKKQ